MSRHRGFCFTCNNYLFPDLHDLIMLGNQQYIVIGFEIGESGTPHLQGYVYFKNAVELHTLYGSRTHFEVAKGTPKQNYDYCTKDGDYVEFGELPEKGKPTWDKIVEAMNNPIENIQTYSQYRKVYNEIKNMEKKDHRRYLYRISYDDRYKYAKKHNSTFDYTLETYNGEDAVFVSPYADSWVNDWIHGYPKTIKRGYEIIRCDPQYVYLMYTDNKESGYILKKYLDMLDVLDEE